MRKNNKNIAETKYDMYERAMTYEDELYSQPCLLIFVIFAKGKEKLNKKSANKIKSNSISSSLQL